MILKPGYARHGLLRYGLSAAVMIVIAACGTDRGPEPLPKGANVSAQAAKAESTPMPNDLRAAFITSVQREVSESYTAIAMDGLVQLDNPAQRFVSTIDRHGLSVEPNEGAWFWAMRTVALGCEGAMVRVAEGLPEARANRVEFVSLLSINNDRLRIVLDETTGALAQVDLYHRPGVKTLGIEDHALGLAIRPDIAQWIQACRIVGLRPIGEGTIGDLIEVMKEPMVLILRDRIVHASRSARTLLGADGSISDLVSILNAQPGTFLRVQNELAKLVCIPSRRVGPNLSFHRKMSILPPSLHTVTAYLAQGLADKEISERTGRSVATIRTYVTRIFERLGVHDRRELMRLMAMPFVANTQNGP